MEKGKIPDVQQATGRASGRSLEGSVPYARTAGQQATSLAPDQPTCIFDECVCCSAKEAAAIDTTLQRLTEAKRKKLDTYSSSWAPGALARDAGHALPSEPSGGPLQLDGLGTSNTLDKSGAVSALCSPSPMRRQCSLEVSKA